MKIGIDIRTLMDARYSGVSEYTFNLIKEILKLASASSPRPDFGELSRTELGTKAAQGIKSEKVENEFRLFYNCFGDCPNIPRFGGDKVKVVKYNYPNKVLNYLLFKIFNWPKIDEALEVDLFFMPHINFIGLTSKSPQPPSKIPPTPFIKGELLKGGVKKILTIHDLSFLRYPEFFSWRKNFWHKMVNVKKLVKRFDVIVAVSENTKRDIVELCGVEESKVKVIYPGIGEEFRQIKNFQFSIFPALAMQGGTSNFQSNSNSQIFKLNADEVRLLEIRNKYKLPDKFILYLGTVEPRKNVEGIIRAYNQLRINNYELRDVKLAIAGGRGWKSDNIFREWEKSEFKDDIKFLGYVDNEDKVYLYNLAAVFVYPSFYEGFGFPPLEAMACGTPVVASFASSLPEAAGEAALMVDPYNINDIARAMKEILTDENLKNKLVARGLEQVKQFRWEKAAGEYLELFNKLQ